MLIQLLEGKWSLAILCALRDGPVRMGQLKRLLPSASKKAIRQRLRELEEARLVVRTDLSHRVLHIEYDLASDMRPTISELLEDLANWGDILRKYSL